MKCHGSYDGLSANILIELHNQSITEGSISIYISAAEEMRYMQVYYMIQCIYRFPQFPQVVTSTLAIKMTASTKNTKMFLHFFVNVVLHFSSKVPGAPTKNVKTFFFFFFYSFYIFLSITADTIKLEFIFKIRSKATKWQREAFI